MRPGSRPRSAACPRTTTGLTTYRPPVQPVPLAVLAGPHLNPVRRTALHDRHEAAGATWMDMGDWKRPLHYGDVAAECRSVHERVGLIDVSTLGKLDVRGRDAGEFLDWLHPNRFSDLRVGRIRYRAMTDDAGIILDDGTVARLGEDRYLMTTGTGSLDAVDGWLRWWLAASDRRVDVTNVTARFAAMNLAGPRARDVLPALTDLDVSPEGLRYLDAREGLVAGVPTVILRIGFVGELAYELHAPADQAAHLWDALMTAGAEFGIRPFGVEAQRVLRLEKQHAIVGQDTDALSDPRGGVDGLADQGRPAGLHRARCHRRPRRAGSARRPDRLRDDRDGRPGRGCRGRARRTADRPGHQQQVEPDPGQGHRAGLAAGRGRRRRSTDHGPAGHRTRGLDRAGGRADGALLRPGRRAGAIVTGPVDARARRPPERPRGSPRRPGRALAGRGRPLAGGLRCGATTDGEASAVAGGAGLAEIGPLDELLLRGPGALAAAARLATGHPAATIGRAVAADLRGEPGAAWLLGPDEVLLLAPVGGIGAGDAGHRARVGRRARRSR